MSSHWWVFGKPVLRDWLFVVCLAVGALAAVAVTVAGGHRGAASLVLQPVGAFIGGMVAVGVLGGSLREFRRGRRSEKSGADHG